MSDYFYVLDLTIYIYVVSILFSVAALIICISLKLWRTRDGKLLLNIISVDLLFACSSVAYLFCRTVQSRYYLAQVAVYLVLLSYASQALIAANRYIVVNFTFTYKNVLTKCRLLGALVVIWTFTSMYLVASLFAQPNYVSKTFRVNDKTLMLYMSSSSIICFSTILSMLSALTVTLEIQLRCTATSHRERLRTLMKSIQTNMAPIAKRKISFQSIRNSFLAEQIPVRKTPVLLFGIHIVTTLCVLNAFLSFIFLHHNPSIALFSKYSTFVMSILISLRPTINTMNCLSLHKLKCFKRVFYKYLGIDLKHNSEYYEDNQKDVKERKRKRSTCSMTVEFSK